MFEEDKQILTNLIKEYSLKEVIKTCAIISRSRAHDCVDLNMQQEAKQWIAKFVVIKNIINLL